MQLKFTKYVKTSLPIFGCGGGGGGGGGGGAKSDLDSLPPGSEDNQGEARFPGISSAQGANCPGGEINCYTSILFGLAQIQTGCKGY